MSTLMLRINYLNCFLFLQCWILHFSRIWCGSFTEKFSSKEKHVGFPFCKFSGSHGNQNHEPKQSLEVKRDPFCVRPSHFVLKLSTVIDK